MQWCSGSGATGAIAPVPIFSVERRSSSCFFCFSSILLISCRNWHLTLIITGKLPSYAVMQLCSYALSHVYRTCM